MAEDSVWHRLVQRSAEDVVAIVMMRGRTPATSSCGVFRAAVYEAIG
jgi:hypothetical protein